MLKVHARKLGDVTILCLRGGIVAAEAATLRNTVQSQANVNMIVLDFGRVNRIDAAGLGLLLELREYVESKGIQFRLMNITKLVYQVFEITCLNSVFQFSSEAQVLSAAAVGLAGAVLEYEPCPQLI